MARHILDDALREWLELLLPPRPRRSCFPRRKPPNHRKALTGILFVLKMGII